MMRKNKKSQVTIFIIIGVLLISAAGFYFYAQTIKNPVEPEVSLVQQQVPVAFDPIKQYTNDCIYSVASNGIRLIGKHGGYASLTNKTLNKASFTITQNPTESDAVAFTKNSELEIPYWWYLKSSNTCNGNCQFSTKRPDLRQSDNSIEKQLERYVDLELKSCLNNFKSFEEQGYKITETGNLKSDVTIASNDILVSVDYPLMVEKENFKTDINQFFVRIPVNLERLYNFASTLTNFEMKHHYLEKHILNSIVAFSGINKDKLPPMSDLQFKFGSSVSWQKTDVKNKLTQLLDSYIPLFQVDGTLNYERNIFDNELQQRLYDSTLIPVANSSYGDIATYFTYLDFWPIYFNLNCKGEKCSPSSANSIIPLATFGIQNYKFSYDLSYPVLVEFQDPTAFNGQGYNFEFFLEGNIRNNNYMGGNFSILETASGSERSQLCDIRTSGNVTVTVTDAVTKKPVDDAQIFYTLIDESCFISLTAADGKVIGQFPIGVGGVVNVVKDGYIGKAIEFDANLDSASTINVEIQPVLLKKFIVKKKNVAKASTGWVFQDNAIDLNDKESAVLSLTRIGDETELEFSAASVFDNTQKESAEIELAPGKYSADITLLANERIVIPARERCEGGILGIGEKCFIIPKIDLGEGSTPGEERFSPGGLKLNITITPEDLQKSVVLFYVVNVDIAGVPEIDRYIEDLDELAKVEEYSTKYKASLQPIFT